jgi:superfamily II DNA or RNA helicase
MLIITIFNSISQVENTTKIQDDLISNELSYLDQNINYQYNKTLRYIKVLNQRIGSDRFNAVAKEGFKAELRRSLYIVRDLEAKRRVLLYKDHKFPSGLLPRLLDFLYDQNIDVKVVDKRIKPKLNQVKLIPQKSFPALRYYQKESVKAAVSEGRGVVVLPTGAGKSLVMVKCIWELGVPTLIVTPSKAITDMMVETMIEYFGKGKVEKLTTKTVKAKKPIGICNIQALVKLKPKALESYHLVVVDEYHHTSSKSFLDVNEQLFNPIYFRIGLTATHYRNDGSDIALEAILSETLVEMSSKKAIDEGYLVKPYFKIVPLKIHLEEKNKNNYQKAYREGIVENESRNEVIAELALEHPKDSVIILVQQVEHGDILKTMITGAVFIHGQEKNNIRQKALEDFRKGKIKCLIGTSVIGEGVDLPIANVLIMAGGGKARSQVVQNIGRVLRLFEGKDKALIYDFTDEDGSFLQEHSNLRRAIYSGY